MAGHGQPFTVTLTVGTGLAAASSSTAGCTGARSAWPPSSATSTWSPTAGPCGCGRSRCWERYTSGTALVLEVRERAARSPGSARRLLELAGGRVEDITGPQVTQAAVEGDPAAVDAFRVVGTWLGKGMADIAAVLDPRVFILGGGVSAAGQLLAGPARAAFEATLTAAGHRPVPAVRVAELGQDAGLIGAADLART